MYYTPITNPIQKRINEQEIVANLCNYVRNINETYIIEHAFFGINENGIISELTDGYMEIHDEYNSVEEGLENINNPSQCVYIEEFRKKDDSGKHATYEKCEIGLYKHTLSACDFQHRIIDIAEMKEINEGC